MVNLRVKLKPGDINDLANSMHAALAENLHEIDYLTFYNVTHLVAVVLQLHVGPDSNTTIAVGDLTHDAGGLGTDL